MRHTNAAFRLCFRCLSSLRPCLSLRSRAEEPRVGESPASEKNIRRRVYDALNVLRSAGVIAYEQDKKTIVWRGLPEQFELKTLETERDGVKSRCATVHASNMDYPPTQRP